MMTDEHKNLIGLERDELAAELAAIGEKPFRAKQLWHWIYHRGEGNFAKMTTLSKEARPKLAERFRITRPEIATEQKSQDRLGNGCSGSTTATRPNASSSPRTTAARCVSLRKSGAR